MKMAQDKMQRVLPRIQEIQTEAMKELRKYRANDG
jgi:hypothetical protein